jgi:hypothetical protein
MSLPTAHRNWVEAPSKSGLEHKFTMRHAAVEPQNPGIFLKSLAGRCDGAIVQGRRFALPVVIDYGAVGGRS